MRLGSDYYKLDFKDAYPQFIKHGVRGNHSLIRQGVRDVRNKNKNNLDFVVVFIKQ